MKTLKLILVSITLLISGAIKAQVSVNVNIGSPPLWGPVGYSDVRYYYLPDVEAYYDIQTSMFIYYGNGVWLHRSYLPNVYANYDLYNGYKVIVNNYYGNTPNIYYKEHKAKYHKGYRGKEQKTIGARPAKGSNSNGKGSNHGGSKSENNHKQQQHSGQHQQKQHSGSHQQKQNNSPKQQKQNSGQQPQKQQQHQNSPKSGDNGGHGGGGKKK